MKFLLHVKIPLKIPFNNTFIVLIFCLNNLEVGRPVFKLNYSRRDCLLKFSTFDALREHLFYAFEFVFVNKFWCLM